MKRWLAPFVLAASLMAPAIHAQPILYGATAGGEGAASTLYTIDPATGVATPVGSGIGFDRCSALEASDAGILYAACRNELGSRVLVMIDRTTGVGTEIGSLGLQVGNVTDISFAPDGTLYGYVNAKSPILLTIDTTTGLANSVGNPTTSGDGNALAFSGATLFHAGSDTLSSIDPTDASSAAACTLDFPDSLPARLNAMDENPATAVVFASARLSEVSQGEPQNFLTTVDTATCVVTTIGPTVDGLDAIAFLVPPDLAITKTDSPDPVAAGSNLTYTITVQNLGLAEATNVLVTDTLPADVTLVSSSGCDEDPSGGDPTCTIASVPGSGSAVVTLVVNVSLAATGPLVNTASIPASAANEDPANDSDTEETTVLPPPDLALTKTDSPDPVTAGAQLTYTVTVQNTGAQTATNVQFGDVLPFGTTLVSTTGCNEDPAGVPVCTIASIAGGGSAVVTIVVGVDPGFTGTLTNNAALSPSAFNTDPANDTDSEDTTVLSSSPFEIPALSDWGLAALALLLVATGALFARRL